MPLATTQFDVLTDIPNSYRADVLVFDDSVDEGGDARRYASIPLCHHHARKRIGSDRASEAPKAVEDEMHYCADCVIDSGYTFHVHISYYRDSGKYYTSGNYLTGKRFMFEIFEEFGQMRRAGVAPGLASASGKYYALVDAFANPHRHTYLFV